MTIDEAKALANKHRNDNTMSDDVKALISLANALDRIEKRQSDLSWEREFQRSQIPENHEMGQ